MRCPRPTRALRSLIALALLAACSGDGTSADPTSQPALAIAPAQRLPPLARALAEAASTPPISTDGGFLLRAAPHRTPTRADASLRAELGTTAADPMRIVATPGGAVGVRRRGVRPSPGHIEGGAVVYEGIQPGVNTVLFSTRGGVEELVIAETPGVTIAYDLDLPRGFSLHRAAAPGLVEVRDARSSARLRLWVKRAWDAGGREIPVEPIVEGRARVRVALDEARVSAWPVVVDPEWTPATQMTIPRYEHTATTLPDGKILIAGGDVPKLGLTEIYDPRTGTFTSSAAMSRRRANHTATLLPNGKVVIAGGDDSSDPLVEAHNPTRSVEVFDPALGTFDPIGNMVVQRSHHTATLLPSGEILFAGGLGRGAPWTTVEVHDSAFSKPPRKGTLKVSRVGHTATLVPDGSNGSVLLAGGTTAMKTTLELLHPDLLDSEIVGTVETGPNTATLLPSGGVLLACDAYSAVHGPGASLVLGGCGPGCAATLLPSGRVLLAGGTDVNGNGPTFDTVMLFDPRGPALLPLHPMEARRELGTATLLPSGLVLMAGGYDYEIGEAIASVETYDPGEATLESTGAMVLPRPGHTATRLDSGKVLLAGGGPTPFEPLEAEIFDRNCGDPQTMTGCFRALGPMITPRLRHTATKLPPAHVHAGHVLLAGGVGPNNLDPINRVERFDPATEWFFADVDLKDSRATHAAVLLPDNSILFAGGGHNYDELRTLQDTVSNIGQGPDDAPILQRLWSTAALFSMDKALVAGGRDPGSQESLDTVLLFDGSKYTTFPSLYHARAEHTATSLPGGLVLVTGGAKGQSEGFAPIASAELFDPQASNPELLPEEMKRARARHAATFLPDEEKVLLSGGGGGGGDTAELYDIASKTFGPLLTMPFVLFDHTSTLLDDGRVLLNGGDAAAIYKPDSEPFVVATEQARSRHTATLLPTGKLLLVGGTEAHSNNAATESAGLFDPDTRGFVATDSMSHARLGHTATLVEGGRVLVTGGSAFKGGAPSESIERWDNGKFVLVGSLHDGRALHTATLLGSGRVLLTGGLGSPKALASAEEVDADGASTPVGSMHHARHRHAAARLPSGRVLIAGGLDDSEKPVPVAEIYDPLEGTFTEVAGSSPINGDARAMVLPSGDILITGDEIAYRFDEAANELSVAGAAPIRTFGAALLPGGRLVICGFARCDTGTEAGLPAERVGGGALVDGHTFTALANGEAFALGLVVAPEPKHVRHTFSYRPFPLGVVRPEITSAPQMPVAGEPAVLKGERFASLSARGSKDLKPLPHVLPRVTFVPAASGAPVVAEVLSWEDTEIQFVAPRTPYHGGGWIYVLVEGVPSEGQWIELAPAKLGAACALDGECADGHCSEGVCCDQACEEGCRSCLANRNGTAADGQCRPISEGDEPRFGCEHVAENVCSSTGSCDGEGDCTWPPRNTECSDPPGGTCERGACVAGCKSNRDCPVDWVCMPNGDCVPFVDPGPAASACSVPSGPGPHGGAAIAAGIVAIALAAARRRRDQKA